MQLWPAPRTTQIPTVRWTYAGRQVWVMRPWQYRNRHALSRLICNRSQLAVNYSLGLRSDHFRPDALPSTYVREPTPDLVVG